MIIVSGASGFLGSAIASISPDDTLGLLRKANSKYSFSQYELDLLDEVGVDAFINEQKKLKTKFTSFVHSAAVTPWSENPDFSTDIVMAKQVKKICEQLNIGQLYFISGWVVYDYTASTPYDEDSTPSNPSTPYGTSKKAVEDYFLGEHMTCKVINLRLASIYGPGQNTPGLIPNLTKKALAGHNIELNAKTTKRDYLFINDFVQMMKKLLVMRFTTSEIINLGSGKGVSVEEVASIIVSSAKILTDANRELAFSATLQEAIPPDNTLSINKAKNLGIIDKTTDIQEGIKQYLKWVKHEDRL